MAHHGRVHPPLVHVNALPRSRGDWRPSEGFSSAEFREAARVVEF
jgi:hypothetical protein